MMNDWIFFVFAVSWILTWEGPGKEVPSVSLSQGLFRGLGSQGLELFLHTALLILMEGIINGLFPQVSDAEVIILGLFPLAYLLAQARGQKETFFLASFLYVYLILSQVKSPSAVPKAEVLCALIVLTLFLQVLMAGLSQKMAYTSPPKAWAGFPLLLFFLAFLMAVLEGVCGRLEPLQILNIDPALQRLM